MLIMYQALGQVLFCRPFHLFFIITLWGDTSLIPIVKGDEVQRGTEDCHDHRASKECSWALNPADWLHSSASLPRCGMGPSPQDPEPGGTIRGHQVPPLGPLPGNSVSLSSLQKREQLLGWNPIGFHWGGMWGGFRMPQCLKHHH